jgi:hypothetical protein
MAYGGGTTLLRMMIFVQDTKRKRREAVQTLAPPSGGRLRTAMVWRRQVIQRRYFVARCEPGVLART